jgi:hypothetical protein
MEAKKARHIYLPPARHQHGHFVTNGAFGPSYDATRSMPPTFHISMNRYFLQDYNGVSLILSLSFERELFPKI